MDANIWKTDNPEWMAEREQEWMHVKANLDKMDPVIPKRSQRFHKELFFKGKLDPILSDLTAMMRENIKPPFDGCLALFRMWYLPEKNLDHFKAIFEEETDVTALSQCRGFMFNPFRLSTFPEEYGMFGGREELLVRIFIPDLDYQKAIVRGRNKFNLALPPHSTMRHCVEHTSAILTTSNVNPYAPGQYLWDHFSYGLEHYQKKSFKGNKDIIRLRQCLRKILDWEGRLDAPRERANAVTLRNHLFERFEIGDFSPPLLQYWNEEKLAYGNGEPYPEL